jgi:hypothetical protein
METLRPIIPYLIPVVLLELGLMAFALRDLIPRRRVNGPKWLWVLIVILVQIIGPIAYLIAGRPEE